MTQQKRDVQKEISESYDRLGEAMEKAIADAGITPEQRAEAAAANTPEKIYAKMEERRKRKQVIVDLDHRIETLHKLLAIPVPDGAVPPGELALIRKGLQHLKTEKANRDRELKSLKLDAELNEKVREFRRLAKRLITRVERFFIRYA